MTKAVYTARGEAIPAFVDGGPIQRFAVPASAGWVRIAVDAACDIARLQFRRVSKRLLLTHTGAGDAPTAGATPSAGEIARCMDIPADGDLVVATEGLEWWVAVDPQDAAAEDTQAVVVAAEAGR